MRRLSIAAGLAALIAVVCSPLGVQAFSDGAPTEISVTPGNQVADGCHYATASWTVYVDGGTSGLYSVWVGYGDGYTSPVRQTSLHTIPWSYTFFSATCSYRIYHQYWSASRSGGGTAHADTYVTSN
jgi:hypothetical protein